jgi:hypothetical protein
MMRFRSQHELTLNRMKPVEKLAGILTCCYHSKIQYNGPGGVYESEGRRYNYPIAASTVEVFNSDSINVQLLRLDSRNAVSG